MPLPPNFSPWEHFQSVLRSVQNRIVRDEFSDANDDDDISTPRGSLRIACLLNDNDSATQTLLRLFFFYFVVRRVQDSQPAIYGIPVTTFQESWTFVPQVKLFFLEDFRDVEQGFSAVEGEITFRLVGESSESLTPAKARTLANRVRTAFANGTGFVWQKGRIKAVYLDKVRGYDFRLLVTNEAEARRLIEQVLDIQQHTPDWDNLSITEQKRTPPIVPPSKTIYGRSRRLPRHRPRADVRFRYAELHIHGLPNPVTLVDRSGMRRDALVQA